MDSLQVNFRPPLLPLHGDPRDARRCEREATRALIEQALADDKAHRHAGVRDGLCALGALAPFARLGHGVPTLRAPQREPFARARDVQEFRSRLRQVAPFLADFGIQARGLVLAGGAASALLMREAPDWLNSKDGDVRHNQWDFKDRYSDFDFFLVGHASDAAATAAIAALGDHLCERWDKESMLVFRSAGCVTFVGTDPRGLRHQVQVVLRRYATLSEVLHGFDLGSSAVAYDGSEVLLSGLGRLAAERGANVLNLPIRRASYERRLARYFERGFDLVLPAMDPARLQEVLAHHRGLPDEHGKRTLRGFLPFLELHNVELDACCACHLDVGCLGLGFVANSRDETKSARAHAPASEDTADLYPTASFEYIGVEATARHNILALAALDAADSKAAAPAMAGKLIAVAEYRRGMTFAGLRPDFAWDAFVQLAEECFRTDGVNLWRLCGLVGSEGAEALARDYMRAKGGSLPEAVRPRLRELCNRGFVRLRGLLPEGLPFRFMGVGDGTALVGHPRYAIEPEDWYGTAYACARANAFASALARAPATSGFRPEDAALWRQSAPGVANAADDETETGAGVPPGSSASPTQRPHASAAYEGSHLGLKV